MHALNLVVNICILTILLFPNNQLFAVQSQVAFDSLKVDSLIVGNDQKSDIKPVKWSKLKFTKIAIISGVLGFISALIGAGFSALFANSHVLIQTLFSIPFFAIGLLLVFASLALFYLGFCWWLSRKNKKSKRKQNWLFFTYTLGLLIVIAFLALAFTLGF